MRLSSRTLAALAITLLACALPTPGRAQCSPAWAGGFELRGVDGAVNAQAIFDDGRGPALYLGGYFRLAGSTLAVNLARFDGRRFEALGSGTDDFVRALAAFDDGSGPALYAAGDFAHAGGAGSTYNIARWNGSSWSSVGGGMGVSMGAPYDSVRALVVHDDGTGPALYAGGTFDTAGTTTAWGVARWDGTSWSSVGSGLLQNSIATSLAVFDDGSGPALFAAGGFYIAGGNFVTVEKWDGASWTPVGTGTSGSVWTLAASSVGGVSALYAGGEFTTAGGVPASNIARWNGTSWSALGSGIAGSPTVDVYTLANYDDGSGSALYVGGFFNTAGGAPARGLARWDGASWTAVMPSTDGEVNALGVFDDGLGGGSQLYAGGGFSNIGSLAFSSVARWNGAHWSGLAAGNGLITGGPVVYAFATHDDGTGSALYAGGRFLAVGAADADYVARWNGSSWSALGSGMNYIVRALASFDDGLGAGPQLYAGGEFGLAGGAPIAYIARWNGASWSSVGGGVDGIVRALRVHDDGSGPALFAAGDFTVAGGAPASHVAKWNGTSWSGLGSGCNATVDAFEVFDDGSGPALFAAGNFTLAGGVSANRVAKWDGASWSALGAGCGDFVIALFVFDAGTGPALYAGGNFTSAGGAPASRIARWNGASWSPVGTGANNTVSALTAHDDGGGVQLYAGGFFTSIGGVAASRIARWNGASWSALGTGVDNGVYALTSFDDGWATGPDLYVGGAFSFAGGHASRSIAEWARCGSPGAPFCSGDGFDLEVSTPCPCGNFGASGNGCANSFVPNGARLLATGATSPDTVVLSASGMPLSVGSIYLKGNLNTVQGIVFGDGLRCADGLLIRLGAEQNVGGASQYPVGAQPTVSVRGLTPPGSGLTAYYQVYYRNAAMSFCPPATFNVSNGYRITW